MSCKHGGFWVMGVYAWCPKCGALRHLIFTESGGQFDWPRWVIPGDVDRAHKLLSKNERHDGNDD